MNIRIPAWWAVLGCASLLLACQNQPAEPEPADTIATSDAAWEDYRARSDHWRSVDRDFIRGEVAAEGLDNPRRPARTHRFGFDPNQPTEWYSTDEGRRIADIVLSFQTPSGGWSKRTDMSKRPRQPGEHFGYEFSYIPTFDNSATTTQIELLAKAHTATGDTRYLEAYVRGVELILEAQYPNGGWPQNFPLRGGYHDYITYNDQVMENNMTALHRVSLGKAPFAQAPNDLRAESAAALDRALDAALATQVVVNGKPTLWGGQHAPRTLEPMKARAYEMVALATAESVSLLDFMMDLDDPSAEIQHAIHSAMAWYENNVITGYRWDSDTREIVPEADAPPIWSRFAEIGTNRPLFGDRDHSVHYDIKDISMERREGYGWYTTAPSEVLEKYEDWKRRFPR
ncbi:PelA/Pel-15E family pectate lyase [Marinimicrobium koreense]|uniref:PelA/Pel-15E family pectate lyase n=1 Tax=Marinimicrobium koreense TaxID=306545 RepID=A0A3N1NMA9_9GAMM|nr:pectate lyase [Marinimicrobium koreense]ROQ20924.1 PelA/Pel-15E family pectate lyase [Marinimicrobium koreense]